MLYRTLAWCAAASGASNAERDQSRALHMHGKRGPQTGNDPRDPHCSGTRTACRQVLWHTRRERRTTGPVGCGPVQRGSHDTGKGLLRNRKMRSYHFRTNSETKTVTIEPGYKDTMVVHMGTSPGKQQGLGTSGLRALRMAGENRWGGKTLPSAPRSLEHPAGPPLVAPQRARGATHRGTPRPRADPCKRSEAAESRCRMAAAHGASKTPVAVHEGSSAARSQELAQLTKDSSRQQQNRTQVWIRETKVWGRRYGRGMESEV